ncbi:MAG: PQQ-binding-like beta-propeller repeat protein [Saprospirales bacterium]|nr:PQQ-binding-like beta-propeller repeat protein [Saprospirales bacterium]
MKKHLLLGLLWLPLALLAQTEVRRTFPISSIQDEGSAVFKTPYGYAVFGLSRQSGAGAAAIFDIFMLRLDGEGQQIELLKIGGATTSESIGRSVVQLPDGGWLLAGGLGNNGPGDKGYLIRLNAGGAVLWTKTFPGLGAFTDIAALPAGGFIAAATNGAVMRLNTSGEELWKNTTLGAKVTRVVTNESGGRCFVLSNNRIAKISALTGQTIWVKAITPPPLLSDSANTSLVVTDLISAGRDRLAVAGYVLLDQITQLYSGYYAGLFTESGEPLWQRYYYATDAGWDTNEGYSIFYMPNSGHFLLAGTLAGKAVVNRLDAHGASIDSMAVNLPGYAVRPVIRKFGEYYVATGGTLEGFQNLNTFFYRSAGNFLRSGQAGSSPSPRARIYPNPVADHLTVDLFCAEAFRLDFRVIDSRGRTLTTYQAAVRPGRNQVAIPLAALPGGAYRLVWYDTEPRSLGFVKN